MTSAERQFSTGLDVRVDALHVQRLLALTGIADDHVPAAYALWWLADHPIRTELLRRSPEGCLPVFARQMCSIRQRLRLNEPYRLTVTITDLSGKRPAARINYEVHHGTKNVLNGEVDIVFLAPTDILRA